MTTRIVRSGEMAVGSTSDDQIFTSPLGVDVALLVTHPESGAVGVANIMFPDSRLDPKRAETCPGVFADTAVVALVAMTMRAAGVKDARQLRAGLLGAGLLKEGPALWDVGSRTLAAVKARLARAGIPLAFEETGRAQNSTVCVDLSSGRIRREAPGHETLEF